MKQMIGSYRYFYNQGIVYLNSLERGYYIPKKVTKTKPPEYIKYEDQFIRVVLNVKSFLTFYRYRESTGEFYKVNS
jgi:hypothetical protein